MREILN